MLAALKIGLITVAGAAILCPLCESRQASPAASEATASSTVAAAVAFADTATARLHISGMTCGTCPTTARVALKRVPGVYGATVTLDDSLGIVRYDPARATAKHIAEELTRLTGYATRILSDSVDHAVRGRG
jgi:periplasmic mercuric ion binding protein